MKTITGHFEWEPQVGCWRPADGKRDAERLVLAALKPDRQGISAWLYIEALLRELPEAYRGRIVGNGSNMFNRGRGLGKDFLFEKEPRHRIARVRTIGLVAQIERPASIRPDIHRGIAGRRCVILDTSQDVEVDHKAGRKNERRLEDLMAQDETDFQPLNRTVNKVKGRHCQRCLATQSRYDARLLGFSHGWWLGDARSETCNGCYWNDPPRFCAELSRDFDPERLCAPGGGGGADLGQGSLLGPADAGGSGVFEATRCDARLHADAGVDLHQLEADR